METSLHDGPVYGPVRSRRLGLSLGVNLLPQTGKICTFDCAYCECGLNAERRTSEGFAARDEVASALGAQLSRMAGEGCPPDVITFAGNGEPTANPAFPEVIDDTIALRDRFAPRAKIAVLSNGTLAARPRVREALLRVDDNILKLDTVDAAYIELLDRPVGAYSVERQIEAYAAFHGHVIIQTMFLRGDLDGHDADNTSERFVAPWLAALERIAPASVMIYTVARATPMDGLEKAPAEVLDGIAARVRALGIPASVSY